MLQINEMKKNKIIVFLRAVLLVGLFVAIRNSEPVICVSPYPDGKNFAFTITDDPDGAKLEKIKPVYELLNELGFKTTMACWVYKSEDVSGMPDPEEQLASETLQDERYLNFIREYQHKGFEIALHTITAGNDKRGVTVKGYERFKELFGGYPEINIMHSKNLENIYWGKNVFKNSILKFFVGLYDKTAFSGEHERSPYFWGDICKEKTRYVRLWGTSDVNTLKFNSSMPYHDVNKPYVNKWFSFSDGYTGKYFSKLLSRKNIDRLVSERGACIVYTHFAAGFCKKNKGGKYIIDDAIRERLVYISRKPQGWFVPVSKLLDRLDAIKNISIHKDGAKVRIENHNAYIMNGVTVCGEPGMEFETIAGMRIRANEDGEILLGDLLPDESKTFRIYGKFKIKAPYMCPTFFERCNMVFQRIKIMIVSHRG